MKKIESNFVYWMLIADLSMQFVKVLININIYF